MLKHNNFQNRLKNQDKSEADFFAILGVVYFCDDISSHDERIHYAIEQVKKSMKS